VAAVFTDALGAGHAFEAEGWSAYFADFRFGCEFHFSYALAGELGFPHSSEVVVAAHDGSSGRRSGTTLAPSGNAPILPSGVS